MQPDLPWNVVGIPPEAREAARAAARREGLPIGEWLTRRILRSFSENPDAPPSKNDYGDGKYSDTKYGDSSAPQPAAFTAVEDKLSAAGSTTRDTDDMLSRVSRAENESSDLYRRVEDQLRAVARRLDTTDRSQTENNRAMNKAAMEINIATREQAQAFDQLGSHVVGLADRLKRVETQANTDPLREAVKGLHQGLSRLADQITETTRQSGSQIATLVNNFDLIANKLAETQSSTRALEDRIDSMDARVRPVEKAGDLLTPRHAFLGQRSRDHRCCCEAGRNCLQTRSAQRATTAPSIAVCRASNRRLPISPDVLNTPNSKPPHRRPIQSRMACACCRNRFEASEKRQRDALGELRAAMQDTATRLDSLEGRAAQPQPAATAFQTAAPLAPQLAPQAAPAPNAIFDLPPFPATDAPPAPAFPQAQQFAQPVAGQPFAAVQPVSGFDIAPPPPFDAPPPPYAGDASLGGNPPVRRRSVCDQHRTTSRCACRILSRCRAPCGARCRPAAAQCAGSGWDDSHQSRFRRNHGRSAAQACGSAIHQPHTHIF